MSRDARRWTGGVMVLALLASGCGEANHTAPYKPKPPEVTLKQPMLKMVPDFEFTGETQAIESVDVRARVGGFLKKPRFEEGVEVKKDSLLFEIDPDTYEQDVKRAKGEVARGEAEIKLAEAEMQRNQELLSRKAVSRTDYDKAVASYGVSKANLAVATAQLRSSELNLGYTKVKAPIDGVISRYYVTEGNLISAGSDKATLLTTIVRLDKIYAVFYVDERAAQLYSKARLKNGKVQKEEVKVELGLNTDGDRFPYVGKVDFADNQLDPATGTLMVRAVFDNPNRLLKPGYTVRLRLYVGSPEPSLVLSERALITIRGKDFVFVVGADNKAELRPVRVGKKVDDLVVIEQGLTKDDWVIVAGLQRVRDGSVVAPDRIATPPDSAKKK